MQTAVAVLLVVGIAFVFFSPALNLQPTAMRAARAAHLAMIAVALCATILCGIRPQGDVSPLASAIAPALQSCDLVDLNCTRLC